MTTSIVSKSNGTQGALQVNGVDSVVFDGNGLVLPSINGGQIAGFRNRIINGDMRINQRAVNGTLPSTFAYSLDRWLVSSSGAAPSVQQVAVSTAGSQLSSALLVTGVAGNTGINIRHRIEAANCRDMAGQTVTLSWWVWQSTSTSMSVTASLAYASTTDNFTTVTGIATPSPATTVTSNNASYVKVVTTFVVPTGATTGLEITLFANTPTVLGSQSISATNVQLELGSVASAFEQRPYGLELALCQRYYQYSKMSCIGYSVAGGNIGASNSYKVTMRAPPVITQVIENSDFSRSNVNTSTTTYINPDIGGVTGYRIATATGNCQFSEIISASAEL